MHSNDRHATPAARASVQLIATAPALAACSRVAVDVRRDGDTFSINASLFAPVPLELAWEVLTDFEHMERFEAIVEEMIRRQRSRRERPSD